MSIFTKTGESGGSIALISRGVMVSTSQVVFTSGRIVLDIESPPLACEPSRISPAQRMYAAFAMTVILPAMSGLTAMLAVRLARDSGSGSKQMTRAAFRAA